MQDSMLETLPVENMGMTFHIDLPNWMDPTGEWKNVVTFKSMQDAIDFARETFGADDMGRIGIITAIEDSFGDWKEEAMLTMRNALATAKWDQRRKIVTLNNDPCENFEDLLNSLVFIADDLYAMSQSPEEFNAIEAESWALNMLKLYIAELKSLGWETPND